MFFDIGWPELMLVGAIALVVIGPKDLPRALRVAGYWLRKARTLSREFQSSVDQMIREAELDDIRRDLNKATEFNLEHEFHKTVDPDGSLAESIKPPDIPDYFEAPIGAAAALPAKSHVATELPLSPGDPEPDFVGFDSVEPATEAIANSQAAAPLKQ